MTRRIAPIAPENAALARPALALLRPHAPATASDAALRAHLEHVAPEGYRLVGAFEDGRAEAASVAGYRVMTMLWDGRLLYVDDLSTLETARGRGHAAALLAWLDDEARRLGCGAVHLDSGVNEARFTAHRQYLRHGLNIVSLHFQKVLR